MIDLILYSINDGDNVINKNLVNGVNVPIHLKQGFDIINPDIVLNGDYRGFNYAHIPSLNRFYFINNIEQLNLRLVKLNMSCDVLETYKSEILNLNAIFIRDSKDGDYVNIEASSDNMIINTFKSDITLEHDSNIVLTTVSKWNGYS